MVSLVAYITDGGEKPFEDWFSSLDVHAANKVNVNLTRLGTGNTSNLKPIKGAFQEFKIE